MIRLGDGSETIYATPIEGTHVHFIYALGDKPATVSYWLENNGQRLNGDGEIELSGTGATKVRVKEPENKGDLKQPTMLKLIVRVEGLTVGEDVIEFMAATVKPLDLEGFRKEVHILPDELGTITVAGKLNTVFVKVEGLTKVIKMRYYTTFGMERTEICGVVFKPGRDGWYQIRDVVFPHCTIDAAKSLTYYFKVEIDGTEQRMGKGELILDTTDYSKKLDRDRQITAAYEDAGIVNP